MIDSLSSSAGTCLCIHTHEESTGLEYSSLSWAMDTDNCIYGFVYVEPAISASQTFRLGVPLLIKFPNNYYCIITGTPASGCAFIEWSL